jgi:hypothetical protein
MDNESGLLVEMTEIKSSGEMMELIEQGRYSEFQQAMKENRKEFRRLVKSLRE